MSNGGVIHVIIESVHIPSSTHQELNILPLDPGEYIKVTIKDNGTGIEEEYLNKIFDPYFSTKQDGEGLGLATCYSIIKNHGGCIFVESEVGVGSAFHIYLKAAKKGDEGKQIVEDVKNSHSGKVLIMDDSEMMRDMLTDTLTSAGYEVVSARDGREAIILHKKHSDVEAIILDLTVPSGMGGMETLEKMLEYAPDVKVIVSSGYSNESVMSNYEDYGFKGVLTKPYQLEEILRVLHDVIMAR